MNTCSDAKRATPGPPASRSSAAAATAEPPIAVERLANEPTPSASSSVSPVMTVICSVVEAELVRGDLREQRLVALTRGHRADAHDPVRVTDACSNSPAERSTHSATPVPTTRPGTGSTSPSSSSARSRQRLEVARVVRPAERRPVGERPHEVAPAQLDRVDPQLARRGVDGGLDQIARLGPSGAAVGRGRHLVRARAGDDHLDGGDVVAPGEQHRGGVRRHRRARQQVGAEVGEHAAAQREDPPVRVQRELHRRRACPRPCGADEEVLVAVLGPAHRPPELLRGERDERRLDRQRALGAEGAADVGHDHADAGLVAVQASARAAPAAGARSARTSRPSADRPRRRRARRAAPSARPPAAGSRARSARRAPPARTRPPRRPSRCSQRTIGSPARGSTHRSQRLVLDLHLLGRDPPPRRATPRPRPRPAARRSAPRRRRAADAGSAPRPARAAA